MRTKRSRDWQAEQEAIKRRRADEERRIAIYKTLPRGPARTYAGSMVPLRSGGYVPNAVERKVNDINSTLYQVNTTGSVTLLCCPSLGSDMNNRIGRKIMLKSCYIRGRVYLESITAAQNNPQQARMMIVYDQQPNGVAPAITDLLVESLPTSQLNLNNRDRFKILCDKEYVFDWSIYSNTATQAVATAGRCIHLVKKYKKLNLETIFNAVNGGSIADIASGALFMVWIGSVVTGSTDCNAYVSTRVRYSDI